ncbi:MAG: dienelactone hydrolase family protein [Chloroflexi bacterium]|nr:MAG: dienelactone hydrolase family protein [Chloroflexota bacterium]
MVGGSGGEGVTLTSADETKFRAHLARAGEGDAGVVIAPDVRGLHSFYEDLADRFASAGIHAIAFDYFGRTAGMDRRADDFDYMPHVRQTTPKSVFADIAASRAKLEVETKARRVFVLGFCFGGRIAFLSSAEQPGLAGVVGFYGRLGKRENEVWPAPAEQAGRMRAPETYPGAPHSFFDRTFNEHKAECDDAWRRVLAFMKTGDPTKTA